MYNLYAIVAPVHKNTVTLLEKEKSKILELLKTIPSKRTVCLNSFSEADDALIVLSSMRNTISKITVDADEKCYILEIFYITGPNDFYKVASF